MKGAAFSTIYSWVKDNNWREISFGGDRKLIFLTPQGKIVTFKLNSLGNIKSVK